MLSHLRNMALWSLVVISSHALAWALLVMIGFYSLNMETFVHVMSELCVSLPFALVGYGIYQAHKALKRQEPSQQGLGE